MTRKEVLIGFFVGIIANVLGTLLYILIFSDLSIEDSIKVAREQGHLGSLLALGALLNLVAFFGFIKLKRDLRAKGVLIATFLTAFIILMIKIF
ncbi:MULTISPECIES: hypothetical protein [Galbibacter]|uniref:Major facilitator superfamily (MFS) profile domain-containing protein n=1 Tax=Galbibacter pacificus TaxID=2996052 RepID=A0ABT6FWL7_9FLAO|nr:hypothetical protein [Galbibacter pacificus]MDG3584070.1 hypothetical protein [Galbibacter pacificus]MDG3587497.1 hypothetical protein [Galbibacter pacificus]